MYDSDSNDVKQLKTAPGDVHNWIKALNCNAADQIDLSRKFILGYSVLIKSYISRSLLNSHAL